MASELCVVPRPHVLLNPLGGYQAGGFPARPHTIAPRRYPVNRAGARVPRRLASVQGRGCPKRQGRTGHRGAHQAPGGS